MPTGGQLADLPYPETALLVADPRSPLSQLQRDSLAARQRRFDLRELGGWPIVLGILCSNSRPSECDSSWFAHFDSDKMIRHHRDVEKDLRYGLLEPEPARFRRSSACFGS